MAAGGMKGLVRPRGPAPERVLIALCALLLAARAAPALELTIGWGYGADISLAAFSGVYAGTSSDFQSPAAASTGGFFDATYARLRISYMMEAVSTQPVPGTTLAQYFSAYLTHVVLAAAVKYPFTFGPVTAFPLLGVEYRLPFLYQDDKSHDLLAALSAEDRAALHELWLQWGAGLDVFTTDRFFFRMELLFGVKLFGAAAGQALTASHSTGSLTLSPGTIAFHAELTYGCRL